MEGEKKMINQFYKERNIKPSTQKGYNRVVDLYTQYHQKKLNELLEEAITQENTIPNKKERAIKQRLLQFRTHLLNTTKYTRKTIILYMKKINTIYNHFDIETPKLPAIGIKDEYETSYFDLPNKEHIKMALRVADPQIQAVILFISSSGTGLSEVANLTIRDFLQATGEYHNTPQITQQNIHEIIEKLYSYPHQIVPTFYIQRQKTGKYYYTFCNNEATRKILQLLHKKDDITLNDKLFDLSRRQIQDRIRVINDKLEFGFKGKYRFFRPHTLRKYHASNIGLSEEHIDMIQGRSKDEVHETYIKANPIELKKIYMNVMDNININIQNDDIINHQEFNITINVMIMGSDFGISI